MKFTIGIIKTLSPNELLFKLQDTTKKVMNAFFYLPLSSEEIKNVSLEAVCVCQASVTETDASTFDTLYNNALSRIMRELVQSELANGVKAKTILENFINSNISNVKSSKSAVKELQKLSLFCASNDYEPSIDLYGELLESSSRLTNVVKLIFKANSAKIVKGEAYDIFDTLTASLLNAYCMMRNIAVENNHENLDISKDMDETEEFIDSDDSKEINRGYSKDDSVKVYLQEIGKYPRLSAEEEISLSIIIKDGANAREKLKSSGLTYDEIISLKKVVKEGELAQNRFAEGNLRLVASIAKRYIGNGMPFLDMIQEGNLGLLKAIEKFDHTRGYKFSTYATWWIRQAITRGIGDQARMIRIPIHMVEKINRVIRTERILTTTLGYIPSLEELAAEMDMTIDEIVEIKNLSQIPVSLDMPIGDDGDSYLGDFVPAEELTPEEYYLKVSINENIKMAFDKKNFTPRERTVLIRRFGLDGYPAETLEEVGRRFHVTRERIRQIEFKCLRKLRNDPSIKRLLMSYVTGEDPHNLKKGININLIKQSNSSKEIGPSIYELLFPNEKKLVDKIGTPILSEEDWSNIEYLYGTRNLSARSNRKFTEEEGKILECIITKVLEAIAEYEKEKRSTETKPLCEILNCTKDDLALTIKRVLSSDEIALLIKRNGGDSIDLISNNIQLSLPEYAKFEEIIETLKIGLSNPYYERNKSIRRSLASVLPASLEEIETYVYPYLTEKEVDFLIYKSGSDDITQISKNAPKMNSDHNKQNTSLISAAKNLIKNKGPVNRKQDARSNTFIQNLKIKAGAFDKKLIRTAITDYELSLIEKKHGTTEFNTSASAARMSAKEIVDYYKMVKRVRKMLERNELVPVETVKLPEKKKRKARRTSFLATVNKKARFNLTLDNLTKYINLYLDDVDIEFITRASGGTDYSKVDRNITFDAKELINWHKLVNVMVREILKEARCDMENRKDSAIDIFILENTGLEEEKTYGIRIENLETVLDYDIIKELSSYMNCAQAIELSLKLGYTSTGEKYSLPSIARTLNIDPQTARIVLSDALRIYKENVEEIHSSLNLTMTGEKKFIIEKI